MKDLSIRISCVTLFVIITYCTNLVSAQPISANAELTIKVDKVSVPGNKLRLVIFHSFLYGTFEQNQHRSFEVTGKNGVYQFFIPKLESLSYFVLITPDDSSATSSNAGIWETGILEPSDSIQMLITKGLDVPLRQLKYLASFTGRGALKLQCLESMRKAALYQAGTGVLFDRDFNSNFHYISNPQRTVMLAVLQHYKGNISNTAFDQLSVDAAFMFEENKMIEIRKAWLRNKEPWKRKKIQQYFDSLMRMSQFGSDLAKSKSPYYARVYIETEIIRELFKNNSSFNFVNLYNKALEKSVVLRDRIITQLLINYGSRMNNRDSLFRNAKQLVVTNPFRKYLLSAARLEEGYPAPYFSLPTSDEGRVKLSDFRGKVVLLDFWFTGCSPCVKFFQYHLDSVHSYFANNPEVVFISISADQNKTEWVKSINTGQYTNPDFINVFTDGKGTKHPVLDDYNVTATGFPCPVLIDSNGNIATLMRSVLTDRHQLIEAIEKLLKK
ncbi:MAG: TlpA family protein disulfide reductase [Sediminibacterium sp.]